ncbi:nitrogen assimilation transcription factor [Colletotrichum tofieldiae]|nr:nitrogen assimilation transcription factor [Colletotrichum tofieldiae]
MSVKEPLEPHSSSTAQHCAKRARVEAGSEPSPVTPISCVKGDNKGEDSDISRALRGPERKKTYRVKNRAAAKRCREKTTQYETDLVNKEKQVTQERVYLDSYVTALKNEVLALRNRILEHGSCDCEMIQGYIARTASSVGCNGHRVRDTAAIDIKLGTKQQRSIATSTLLWSGAERRALRAPKSTRTRPAVCSEGDISLPKDLRMRMASEV